MNESTLVPRKEWGSDLDWLARNVHEWPCDPPFGTTLHWSGIKAGEAHFISVYSELDVGEKYTKEQWLTRRSELQNKPSWADAPEWTEWLAQDESGFWYWYASKPTHPGMKSWWPEPATENNQCGKGEVIGDWCDTLEKRPEAIEMPSRSNQQKPSTDIPECAEVKQFEPFVSVEDAATAKQPAPKGSGNPILGMVLADLTNRALEGKEKYGEPLLARNGRNPLWDAYQEALDLAMYLRQSIEERNK